MYVVTGISGQTGHHVAKELLRLGHQVLGLTRQEPSEVQGAPAGAELRQLNLEDTESLVALLKEAEGFYGLIPPNWATKDYLGAAAKVADSLTKALPHVPRAVLLSSIAVQHAEGTGPIQALRPLERYDGDNATLIRASYFVENLAAFVPAMKEGTLPTYWDPEKAMPMISVADIGTRAAQLLVSEKAQPVVQITGPEDHSFAEVARVAGDVLHRKVDNLRLPANAIIEPLREMGAGQIAELYAEMNEAVEDDRIVFESGVAVERGTTPLRDSLAKLF